MKYRLVRPKKNQGLQFGSLVSYNLFDKILEFLFWKFSAVELWCV